MDFSSSQIVENTFFLHRSEIVRPSPDRWDIMKNQIIKVDKTNINNAKEQSKIIRISLLTPNLGDGIESIEKMKPSDFAWSTLSSKELFDGDFYQIIYDNEILSPWKLIRKI